MTLAIAILGILCGARVMHLAIKSLQRGKLVADDVVLNIEKKRNPVQFRVGVVAGIVGGIVLILFSVLLVVFSIVKQAGK